MQVRRVSPKFSTEIENMAVRVAFAENRDEAEDVTLETEARAVGLDHAFGSELRGAIQGSLDWEGGVLGRRKHLRFAVDRSRRRKRDLLHVVGAHCFQHVEGRDRVLLKVALRMFDAKTNIRIGR